MPTDGTDVKACLILGIFVVACVIKWKVKKLIQCFCLWWHNRYTQ